VGWLVHLLGPRVDSQWGALGTLGGAAAPEGSSWGPEEAAASPSDCWALGGTRAEKSWGHCEAGAEPSSAGPAPPWVPRMPSCASPVPSDPLPSTAPGDSPSFVSVPGALKLVPLGLDSPLSSLLAPPALPAPPLPGTSSLPSPSFESTSSDSSPAATEEFLPAFPSPPSTALLSLDSAPLPSATRDSSEISSIDTFAHTGSAFPSQRIHSEVPFIYRGSHFSTRASTGLSPQE